MGAGLSGQHPFIFVEAKMTPLLQDTVKWMSDVLEPTEFQWFDVSGSTLFEIDKLDMELMQNHRPPFDKCIIVWQGATAKVFFVVMGENPAEGIIIQAWGSHKGERPKRLPSLFYCVADEKIQYGPVDEDEVVEQMDADMLLGFVHGWYATLAQGCQAHIAEAKDTFTNRRKIAAGKKPMYEWRTVLIEPQKPKSEHQGGTHASPRLHDRRGHLRRLKSGKNVWVRSCKVGKAELGTIFHDYEVRA